MPIDVKEKTIRIRQKDPSLFVEKSFRTFSGKGWPAGIQAVWGKRPGSDELEVQSFIFDSSKWTTKKAKEWAKEFKDAQKEAKASRLPRKVAHAILHNSTAMADAFRRNKRWQERIKNTLGLTTMKEDGHV